MYSRFAANSHTLTGWGSFKKEATQLCELQQRLVPLPKNLGWSYISLPSITTPPTTLCSQPSI
ncbi:hypothetical protein K443DRAFT_673286 [Laccaria amethystina LaAM-08-1]|uniref:Uncharacterized protein n=1 Tax=Laccaria amethystina LaAM-08-1 TaxID=1095629 RepID=A0A0C9YI42_9AGAR|nr:hypothetical protein K443DRAFT_673286 [Laccaria amethystina LaAM-08-1]